MWYYLSTQCSEWPHVKSSPYTNTCIILWLWICSIDSLVVKIYPCLSNIMMSSPSLHVINSSAVAGVKFSLKNLDNTVLLFSAHNMEFKCQLNCPYVNFRSKALKCKISKLIVKLLLNAITCKTPNICIPIVYRYGLVAVPILPAFSGLFHRNQSHLFKIISNAENTCLTPFAA